jgi:hypothetical protein
MTPEEDALGQVVALLERLSIPYMVTGSIATSYHGRPRATHDGDVVIDPTSPQLDALVSELARAKFYVDLEGARRAMGQRLQFNVIEITRAVKIDLIFRKERPFSEQEFSRRQRVDLPIGRSVGMVFAGEQFLHRDDLEPAILGAIRGSIRFEAERVGTHSGARFLQGHEDANRRSLPTHDARNRADVVRF